MFPVNIPSSLMNGKFIMLEKQKWVVEEELRSELIAICECDLFEFFIYKQQQRQNTATLFHSLPMTKKYFSYLLCRRVHHQPSTFSIRVEFSFSLTLRLTLHCSPFFCPFLRSLAECFLTRYRNGYNLELTHFQPSRTVTSFVVA